MQVMQNVARRYGLVCLLHEKPFQGVNGSGKHNNWSMGTDTGMNLLDPGDTPHENLLFLFFCSAVIQAVNAHQEPAARVGRQRGPGPPPGRETRRPPAIISIFLGAELEKVFGAIESGSGDAATAAGVPVARRIRAPRACRCTAATANRTSPFAFTGNKFEFRAPSARRCRWRSRTRC